jgi:hypothetical protein
MTSIFFYRHTISWHLKMPVGVYFFIYLSNVHFTLIISHRGFGTNEIFFISTSPRRVNLTSFCGFCRAGWLSDTRNLKFHCTLKLSFRCFEAQMQDSTDFYITFLNHEVNCKSWRIENSSNAIKLAASIIAGSNHLVRCLIIRKHNCLLLLCLEWELQFLFISPI